MGTKSQSFIASVSFFLQKLEYATTGTILDDFHTYIEPFLLFGPKSARLELIFDSEIAVGISYRTIVLT